MRKSTSASGTCDEYQELFATQGTFFPEPATHSKGVVSHRCYLNYLTSKSD